MYDILFNKKFATRDKILDIDEYYIVRKNKARIPYGVNNYFPDSVAGLRVTNDIVFITNDKIDETIEEFMKKSFFNVHLAVVMTEEQLRRLTNGNSLLRRISLKTYLYQILK